MAEPRWIGAGFAPRASHVEPDAGSIFCTAPVEEVVFSSGIFRAAMKNPDRWRPTKYVYRRGRLMGSRDTREVAAASRLNADLVAGFYHRALPIHARGRLLDLGCGKVPLYQAYRNFVTDTVCVDWGNTRHKSEHLDFECDLTQILPLDDEMFDTIILSDVLEHIPNPTQLWSEMRRVLAPGGKILLNVPFYCWIHERPHDYYRYTEFALRRFVEEAHLELVEIGHLGGSLEVVTDVVAKNLAFLSFVGRGPAIFVQFLTRWIGKTPPGRIFANKTGALFPMGYFLVAMKP